MIFILISILFIVGLIGCITQKNIIKIIMSIIIMRFALSLFFITSGYIKDGNSPIVDINKNLGKIVDPLSQTLILIATTFELASVIILLSLALRLYEKYNTFNIAKIRKLKG